eukprot:GHRR01006053.1.p1 GENE.GHRR01006053.1~~GHRR01006053.1.p1  ORF type:complete len:169 (+),score=7.73 GHRR01006053.1:597-1103(+)
MVRSIFLRPWDLLCVCWFLAHIPMTILFDAQSIMPAHVLTTWPQPLKDVLQWHIRTNGDYLVRDNPIWFVAFVWCEVAIQLPFFLIASYAYLVGRNWIRIPAIMYGVHAATTVVPMLADFWYGQGRHSPQKELLCLIYGTYLVFPMLIALVMAFSRIPFPTDKKKKTV